MRRLWRWQQRPGQSALASTFVLSPHTPTKAEDDEERTRCNYRTAALLSAWPPYYIFYPKHSEQQQPLPLPCTPSFERINMISVCALAAHDDAARFVRHPACAYTSPAVLGAAPATPSNDLTLVAAPPVPSPASATTVSCWNGVDATPGASEEFPLPRPRSAVTTALGRASDMQSLPYIAVSKAIRTSSCLLDSVLFLTFQQLLQATLTDSFVGVSSISPKSPTALAILTAFKPLGDM